MTPIETRTIPTQKYKASSPAFLAEKHVAPGRTDRYIFRGPGSLILFTSFGDGDLDTKTSKRLKVDGWDDAAEIARDRWHSMDAVRRDMWYTSSGKYAMEDFPRYDGTIPASEHGASS